MRSTYSRLFFGKLLFQLREFLVYLRLALKRVKPAQALKLGNPRLNFRSIPVKLFLALPHNNHPAIQLILYLNIAASPLNDSSCFPEADSEA